MVSCGDCIHFMDNEPYQWGVCRCPVPFMLEDMKRGVVWPKNKVECEMFVGDKGK